MLAESTCSSASVRSSTSTSSILLHRKRRIDEDDGDGSECSHDGREKKRRRGSTASFSTSPTEGRSDRLRLACPYYRRNPLKYSSSRSCVGPGWDTVHRLKQHLYRQHMQPICCPRCNTVFEDIQSLKKHLMKADVCSLVSNPSPVDGMSSEQERMIRSKHRMPKCTEEEKWKGIYRILFPGDKDIPPPCTSCARILPLTRSQQC
jgi:hypothetical protein